MNSGKHLFLEQTPLTAFKIDRVPYERVKAFKISIWDAEYIVRKEYLRFIQDQKLAALPKVIDFGAGNSPYINQFQSESYIRADVEQNFSGTIDVLIDPVRPCLPFHDGHFDLAICTDVLEHVEDEREVGRELFRVIKPGGSLWLTMPLLYREHESPFDYRRLTSFGLKRFAEDMGFQIAALKTVGNSWSAVYTIVHERFAQDPCGHGA
jgi:SAM-dependent methyltransferase